MDRCNCLAKMSIEKTVEYLKKERICFRCFEKEHRVRDCPSGIVPQCDECPYKHHTIMHGYHLVKTSFNGDSNRGSGGSTNSGSEGQRMGSSGNGSSSDSGRAGEGNSGSGSSGGSGSGSGSVSSGNRQGANASSGSGNGSRPNIA